MKGVLKAFGWGLAVVVVLLAGLVLWLTFPTTPNSATGLTFQGFTHLPKGRGFVTVLDYMTVDGDTLFATNTTGGLVYEIALGPNPVPNATNVRVVKVGRAPHGVVVDPSTGRAFVTRSGSNKVDVFDPRSGNVLKRLAVPDDPDADIYLPVQKLVYVANGDAADATLIDPATQRVAATIPLGGKPEAPVFDPRSNLVYQNLNSTNAVGVVDATARAVEARWPIEGCEAPTGIAIDAARRLLFIGCGGNSKLAEFSLDTHRTLASIDVGGGPDVVEYDSALRRVYVTGRSGVLSAVDASAAGKLTTVATIRLHFAAHTLAVDPARHRLYVAYASLFIAPRIAVFSTP